MAEIHYRQAVRRSLRLVCPRCGRGPLFQNLFSMLKRCPECGLKYERAPGYFLGSTYINYGFTVLTVIPMYMVLHYCAGFSNDQLMAPLVTYCTIVPLILFRYARAYWLAMDCYCDPVGFGMLSGRPLPRPPIQTSSNKSEAHPTAG